MASGRLAISHDTFREQFPMDRRHCYIRDLLTSTGVLPPYTLAIERIGPWLTELIAEHTRRTPRCSTGSPAGTSYVAYASTPPTAP